MRMYWYGMILLPAVLAAACSADKAPAPEAAPAPPQKTVFDPLTQQMDRARQVQGTVDAQAQDTRKAIEAAESGGEPSR